MHVPIDVKRPSMNSTHGGGSLNPKNGALGGIGRDDNNHNSNTSLGFVSGQYKTSQSFFPSEHSNQKGTGSVQRNSQDRGGKKNG